MTQLTFMVEDARNRSGRIMTVTPDQHGVTIHLEGCPHPVIVDLARDFLRVFQGDHDDDATLLGEIQCFTG